jgi:Family of unknown function (DUF6325)/Short C-terminal domain
MGPVELIVLTFPGALPGPGAVRALAGLRLSGAVRILDTLLVVKAADGSVSTMELSDIPGLADVAQPQPLSLIAVDDAEEVGETLDPCSCAVLTLVEQTWAAEAAEAVRESGGELAASVQIPAQAVTFSPGRHAAASTQPGADVTGRLNQLSNLLERGVLTQEEFVEAKAKVLARP